MPWFLQSWLGTPAWAWLAFGGVAAAVLAADLAALHGRAADAGPRRHLVVSCGYVALGLAWSLAVYGLYLLNEPGAATDPRIAAAESPQVRAWTAVKLYLAGYLVEKTLAVDNVYVVISAIFAGFAVPPALRHRVLFWGILAAILLRALMIGAGVALLSQFAWLLYAVGALLVVTGLRMLAKPEGVPDVGGQAVLRVLRRHLRVTGGWHGERLLVRLPVAGTGRAALWATPLLPCLVLVVFADLVFAIDSVPAIFAITTEPFLVFTSNVLAVMGLHALVLALASVVERLRYLRHALALVLVSVGAKVFVGDWVFDGKVPASISLAVTGALLLGGVLYSLRRTRATAAP